MLIVAECKSGERAQIFKNKSSFSILTKMSANLLLQYNTVKSSVIEIFILKRYLHFMLKCLIILINIYFMQFKKINF